jgi:hypothetical protein
MRSDIERKYNRNRRVKENRRRFKKENERKRKSLYNKIKKN